MTVEHGTRTALPPARTQAQAMRGSASGTRAPGSNVGVMHSLHPAAELGTILSFWAHPDDETFLAGALMAAAVANDQRVVCVSCTAGEQGTDDPATWPPERLGPVRRLEAAAAMATLGVREHALLDLPDGGLADLGELGVALASQWLDEIDPDTILTFGPDGITGHTDHITVHRWVTAAWERRGRRGRLLYAASTDEHLARFAAMYAEQGVFMTDELPTGVPLANLAIDLRPNGSELARKLAALRAMPSQTATMMARVDPTIYAAAIADEAFVDAAPQRAATPDRAVTPRF